MNDEKTPPHSLASFLRRPATVDVDVSTPRETTSVTATSPTSTVEYGHTDPPHPPMTTSTAVDTPSRRPSTAAHEDAPSFTRVMAVRQKAPLWCWPLLAALTLLLALQLLLADRARLAADARWRPLLQTLCGTLRCTLPTWHEPTAFTLLNREVRPLTGVPGVLQVQASFRNDARWAQAWPGLQLSLSDADGRLIGSRVVSPQDYLGHPMPPSDAFAPALAPGQGAHITFRVREPAASTAAFEFDFR